MRIKNLFYNFCWGIGYREYDKDAPLDFEKKYVYQAMIPPRKFYIADPFLFEYEGEHFLFAEKMIRNRGIGSIAFCKIDEGKKPKWEDAIVENFHMSYPNVFQYKDHVYMIPETSAVNELRLYRAVQFPFRWELDTILLSGKQIVDSSFFFSHNQRYLVTHDIEDENALAVWSLDMDVKKLRPVDEKEYRMASLRPGGNSFFAGSDELRPLQDCSEVYGKKLLLQKRIKDERLLYCEEQIGSFSADNICLLPHAGNPERIHTLNRDSRYEVIDYLYTRFYPFLIIQKILRKIWRKSNENR